MGDSWANRKTKDGFLASSPLLGILLFVGCAGYDAPEIKYRALKAPQSETQIGYVIDLSDKNMDDRQTEELLQQIEAAGGKIRSINPAHGLFEVFEMEQVELEKLAPAGVIHKNKFWRKKNRRETQAFLQNFCLENPAAPKMIFKSLPLEKKIAPEEPNIFLRDGKTLDFSVSMVGATSYRWEVYGPTTSTATGLKVLNRDLSFIPDELGEYNVFLLVKLADNKACWRRFLIGVTDNVPFTGRTGEDILPVDIRLKEFPHLESLGLRTAWQKSEGFKSVIAILDTGVDYNHPDLADNMFVNLTDVPGDNLDGDRNKFLNDYLGWDFVNNDNSPYDDEMHGTHVAGLAASKIGVAPKASILAVKVIGPFGGDMGTLAGGIYYAIDRGAKIINMSLGGGATSPALNKALEYAQQRGVLVVVASGNDAEDIDVKPTFPASSPYPNILTVAATDLRGNLTDYTNIGAKGVDVAAPGGSDSDGGLQSTFYKNLMERRYVRAQGTSMATPLVSGIAALILSINPTYKAADIKNLIISGGTLRGDYQGKIGSQKLVSAEHLFTTGLTQSFVGLRP